MGAKTRRAQAALLKNRIDCLKYSIFCFSAVMWIQGAALLAVTIWSRADTEVAEMVEHLDIYELYMGSYILIAGAVAITVIGIFGCGAALMLHQLALFINTGLQALCFILILAGATVLLDYSTNDSQIQPLIRESMFHLMVNSQYEQPRKLLKAVQEGVQCCGADGPRDYLRLLKPLPLECRDSLTGNVYPYGCVEGIPWYLENRSGWIAGLALSLCLMHVIQGVLSLLLIGGLKKQEKV